MKTLLDHVSAITGAVLFVAGTVVCAVLLIRGGPSILWMPLALCLALTVTSFVSLARRGRDTTKGERP